jgi:hypothetical protein
MPNVLDFVEIVQVEGERRAIWTAVVKDWRWKW